MNTPNETPDHPLTETAAAELWDTHAADTVPWDDWYGGSRRALTAMLRAAFDAGQKYQDDLEDDTIRNIMKDVHHLRVERDTADNVVADLTARLDAERFDHANTAVKVKRVEALADDMDHDADLLDQTDDLRLHLIAATHREDATRLRTALNGGDA